jgi:hypothetical protein
MASKYGRKLGKLDGSWKKTKNEFGDSTGEFETVPTGNYVLGKLNCVLEEDPNGLLRIAREQTILEGDHADFVVKDRMNLDPSIAPRGQEFVLKWLNLLGYQVDSLADDLEETLDAINANEDATFQATIKEKDGWNNVFYNKVLEEGSAAAEPGEDENPDEGGETERDEMPDIDDMSKRQLKKLIKDEKLDVDLSGEPDEDDIRDAIEEAWKMPSVGADEEPEPEKETGRTSRRSASRKDKGGDDEKLRKALFELGDAFGIDVNADDNLATLKKEMKDYTFKKKELEAKEVKLLEDAGLSETIK